MSKIGKMERSLQIAIVEWADGTGVEELRYLHSSLNGEKLSIGQAIQARRAGMRSGVPDLCLPLPTESHHGLYIELKSGRGRLSPGQTKWAGFLRSRGYRVETCRTFDEARGVICEHVKNHRRYLQAQRQGA
jgi:hypothetical protein